MKTSFKLKHYKADYEDEKSIIINAESNIKAIKFAITECKEHGTFKLYQIDISYNVIKTIL